VIDARARRVGGIAIVVFMRRALAQLTKGHFVESFPLHVLFFAVDPANRSSARSEIELHGQAAASVPACQAPEGAGSATSIRKCRRLPRAPLRNL
jgi:hypothetical protein